MQQLTFFAFSSLFIQQNEIENKLQICFREGYSGIVLKVIYETKQTWNTLYRGYIGGTIHIFHLLSILFKY